MKRLFGALVVGTMVFGVVMASAANLNVNASNIQVGSDSSLVCDPDGVSVDWNVRQDGVITSIQVNDVESTCEGDTMFVYLLDGAGNIIGTGGELSAATGAAPLTGMGTPLFAPDLYNAACDASSCKVQIGATDNDLTNYGSMPIHGVPGTLVEGIRIIIG